MVEFRILHERPDCIGCGACAAITPKFWSMADDGLSHLAGSTKEGEAEALIIEEKDFLCNQEAAEVCPVQIIHVEKVEEKKD